MSATRKTTAKPAAEDVTSKATETLTSLNSAMTEGFERMTSGMNDFGAFGQENVEAMVESASTVAKGVEKLATENAEFAKKQFEAGSASMQSFASIKTPQEFFEAQSKLMRTAMEAQISQVNKVSDIAVSVARDAATPLSKRYTAFVELMQAR